MAPIEAEDAADDEDDARHAEIAQHLGDPESRQAVALAERRRRGGCNQAVGLPERDIAQQPFLEALVRRGLICHLGSNL